MEKIIDKIIDISDKEIVNVDPIPGIFKAKKYGTIRCIGRLGENGEEELSYVCDESNTKYIDSKTWDALPKLAQSELSAKGFMRGN